MLDVVAVGQTAITVSSISFLRNLTMDEKFDSAREDERETGRVFILLTARPEVLTHF